MSSFKTGDKVVFIGAGILKLKHGALYTVEEVSDSLMKGCILIQVKEVPLLAMYCDKFISEEIYNSPLYKALKE